MTRRYIFREDRNWHKFTIVDNPRVLKGPPRVYKHQVAYFGLITGQRYDQLNLITRCKIAATETYVRLILIAAY